MRLGELLLTCCKIACSKFRPCTSMHACMAIDSGLAAITRGSTLYPGLFREESYILHLSLPFEPAKSNSSISHRTQRAGTESYTVQVIFLT
jgi:hypothetical protein